MIEPRALSIIEAGRKIRKKELSAMDLVCSCLERISQREPIVRAWVEVYETQAIEAAQQCDKAVSAEKPLGALHGIPMGVKDIIDVKGMWTRAGCSVYPPRLADSDALAVARLRSAGAIILGKTQTTAFANNDPGPTRNPWNPVHTPGGSSSGSGAAVADQMCLAALGTQTGGSVLRPSAYNGIVGLKPTHAKISMDGVIPVSWTLDHMGAHARQVEDARTLFNLLKNDMPDRFASMPPRSEQGCKPRAEKPFRLGFFHKFCSKEASPKIALHLESVCRTFEQAGAQIVILDLSESFAKAAAAHRIIMDTELSMYHNKHFKMLWEKYPPNIRTRIKKGLEIFGHDYVNAIHQRIAFQQELSVALESVDAGIMPSAPTTAPVGLSSTGSPVFCVPWSMAGFPSITIPSGLDDQGLPLAVQICGKPYCEGTLLNIAAWCEGLLPFTFSPKEKQL